MTDFFRQPMYCGISSCSQMAKPDLFGGRRSRVFLLKNFLRYFLKVHPTSSADDYWTVSFDIYFFPGPMPSKEICQHLYPGTYCFIRNHVTYRFTSNKLIFCLSTSAQKSHIFIFFYFLYEVLQIFLHLKLRFIRFNTCPFYHNARPKVLYSGLRIRRLGG